MLVAEADLIVRFIAIVCRPYPYIDSLHVRPFRRSAGLGGCLLITAIGEVVRRSHETACLHVIESSIAAIRLHERQGGVISGRTIKSIPGHDVPNLGIEWRNLEDASRLHGPAVAARAGAPRRT